MKFKQHHKWITLVCIQPGKFELATDKQLSKLMMTTMDGHEVFPYSLMLMESTQVRVKVKLG